MGPPGGLSCMLIGREPEMGMWASGLSGGSFLVHWGHLGGSRAIAVQLIVCAQWL